MTHLQAGAEVVELGVIALAALRYLISAGFGR
jgi:hypothetical protein